MESPLPVSLKYDITAVLRNNKDSIDKIEIEARIRDPKKISRLKFLEEKLLEDDYSLEKSHSIDFIKGDKRTTYKDGEYFNTSKTPLMSNKFYDNKHNLKISVVKEELTPAEEPKKYDMVRNKERRSYKKGNFSIDITEVTNKTELEIEVIKAKFFDFLKFNEVIAYVFLILFETEDNVVEDFTTALGRKDVNLNRIGDYFSRARDLEINDLTNNGILKPFTISIKADGVTAFLYFHESGIYLITSIIKNPTCKKIAPPSKEINSLFVGELISKDKLKEPIKNEFLFLPYDCLRHNNIDIRNHNYLIRYGKCQNIYDKVFGNILVNQKHIYRYKSTVESLNETVIQVFKNINKLNYYTDGIIFTPIKSPYITDGQKINKNRKLSKYLDVCKYKKPEDLTIDFKVMEDGVHTTKGLFLGTDKFPIKEWSFNLSNKKELIGKIIEFKPREDFEGKVIYEPVRDRTEDRGGIPNGKYVAETLWRLRYVPIEKNTLEGKTIQLMKRYHNQVKQRLIDNMSGFVIDIGSGNGSEMPKYLKNNKIKEVLFIEPCEEFIKEFKRRRSNLNLRGREYRIIKSGGEETEKILNEVKEYLLPKIINKNDNLNINMMISLSFFWKDKEMLNSLVNTITQIREIYKGKVLFNFLTIEGSALRNLFDTRGNHIKLNGIELKKISDKEVYVDIKTSKTVFAQTEFFVNLNRLWELSGYTPIETYEADGMRSNDFILSENERTYSSLFIYGSAQYISKNFDYVCLPVNETKGTIVDGKTLALGDDEKEEVHPIVKDRLYDFFKTKSSSEKRENLYRLSTMKKEGSLNHAILKILNESYKDSDFKTRIKLAKKLKIKLEDIPFKTLIISKDNIEEFGKETDGKIILLKCGENSYEPIVKIRGDSIDPFF